MSKCEETSTIDPLFALVQLKQGIPTAISCPGEDPSNKDLEGWMSFVLANADISARHLSLSKFHFPAPYPAPPWARDPQGASYGCTTTSTSSSASPWTAGEELFWRHPVKYQLVVFVAKVVFVVERVCPSRIPDDLTNINCYKVSKLIERTYR